MRTGIINFWNVLLLLVIFPAFSLPAAVIEIPTDYTAIQEGINQAVDGDTVLVAPDVYYENINFIGKNITLSSHYLFDHDMGYIAETVIDGIYALNPDSMSTVTFCSDENEEALLQGFTIRNGSGTKWIDPQYPQNTWLSGGGIFIFMASPTIRNNHIESNHVTNDGSYDGASGGGLICFRGNPIIINNVITFNQADYGAGIVVDYSGALVKNNIVAHNSGGQLYGGGGFYFIGNDEEPIIVENNTIIGNHSETTGGAMRMWSSVVDVLNNIIWGNTQNSGGPLYGAGASSITYCDIEGGFTGEGNIDEYPAFADTTTCILTETSPCVDAGNPDIMYNDPEDPFNPGNALYPALGTLRNDMGAYGGGGSENWVVNDENLLKPCANKIFMQNFPNPFNPGTAISCHIPPAINDEFALVIYNIKGQLIRVMPLHQGCRTASETGENRYTFTWNGKDEQGNPVTSGIYFYRLTLPDSPTRKMLLMK